MQFRCVLTRNAISSNPDHLVTGRVPFIGLDMNTASVPIASVKTILGLMTKANETLPTSENSIHAPNQPRQVYRSK